MSKGVAYTADILSKKDTIGDPRQSSAISSREWNRVIGSLRVVYFWNFPHIIFGLELTLGNGSLGKQNQKGGDYCTPSSLGREQGPGEAGGR